MHPAKQEKVSKRFSRRKCPSGKFWRALSILLIELECTPCFTSAPTSPNLSQLAYISGGELAVFASVSDLI
jgi:hypothetical protein